MPIPRTNQCARGGCWAVRTLVEDGRRVGVGGTWGIFLRFGKELGSMGWQNAKQRTTGKRTGQEKYSLPLPLCLKKKNGGRGKFIKVSSAR